MVLNGVKLLCSIDLVVLKQDAGYCLVAGISFHDCLEVSVVLVEDGSGEELFSKFVKVLLLLISPSERDIFGQVDHGSCFGTPVVNKSTVVIWKA